MVYLIIASVLCGVAVYSQAGGGVVLLSVAITYGGEYHLLRYPFACDQPRSAQCICLAASWRSTHGICLPASCNIFY
jgi:hypothetical protein